MYAGIITDREGLSLIVFQLSADGIRHDGIVLFLTHFLMFERYIRIVDPSVIQDLIDTVIESNIPETKTRGPLRILAVRIILVK